MKRFFKLHKNLVKRNMSLLLLTDVLPLTKYFNLDRHKRQGDPKHTNLFILTLDVDLLLIKSTLKKLLLPLLSHCWTKENKKLKNKIFNSWNIVHNIQNSGIFRNSTTSFDNMQAKCNIKQLHLIQKSYITRKTAKSQIFYYIYKRF